MDPRSLLRVVAEDEEYRRQAAAEAEFWHRVHPCSLEATEGVDEGPIDRYTNRRFTGDETRHWYESVAERGTFRRGALLGTSSLTQEARILETNPLLHLTFYDVSASTLKRREEVLGQRFPGRVATRVADLNFVELSPNSYDVVLSSSTIHHVTNLEYLAHQLNRTLVEGGYFFLEDYVGEPRFQFAPPKKQVYAQLFNRDRVRQGIAPSELIWLDASDLSPFCGVRSDEILKVFRTHLEEIVVRTAGTFTVPLGRSRPAQDFVSSPWVSDDWVFRGSWWRFIAAYLQRRLLGRVHSPQTLLSMEFLNELFLVGEILGDAGIVTPALAFATYRKRS